MAAGNARARRGRPVQIDTGALHATVEALRVAQDLAAGEAALASLSALIAMPKAIWSPDVAWPLFEPSADAFMRRQGWPEEIITGLWQEGVALRMPLNIRCRFEHTPFAISLSDDHRRRRAPYSGEQKRVAAMMLSLGFHAVLVVPVHLPRGRVAMLGWAGPQTLVEVEALLAAAAPALLAAGHYFSVLAAREAGDGGLREEERTPLTPREWDCLRLLAQGFREAEIARQSGIAPTTVRYHLDNAAAKFGAKTRAQAAAIAAGLGLVGDI